MAGRTAATTAVVRRAPDYALLSVVTVLVILGLIAVYSSSYPLGYTIYDTRSPSIASSPGISKVPMYKSCSHNCPPTSGMFASRTLRSISL